MRDALVSLVKFIGVFLSVTVGYVLVVGAIGLLLGVIIEGMTIYVGLGIVLLVAVIIIYVSRRVRARHVSDTKKLLDSMMANAEANLGYPPDSASTIYLAAHPGLSAKIWGMLGAGGASISGHVPEHATDCDYLLKLVRDEDFRKEYPCACAIIQYAVYLCSSSMYTGPICAHPLDELQERSKSSSVPEA